MLRTSGGIAADIRCSVSARDKETVGTGLVAFHVADTNLGYASAAVVADVQTAEAWSGYLAGAGYGCICGAGYGRRRLVVDSDFLRAGGAVSTYVGCSVSSGQEVLVGAGLVAFDIADADLRDITAAVVADGQIGDTRSGYLAGAGNGGIDRTGDGWLCLVVDGDFLRTGSSITANVGCLISTGEQILVDTQLIALHFA